MLVQDLCVFKDKLLKKCLRNIPDLKYANDINVDEKFEKHMYALFDTMIDPESRRYLSRGLHIL